MKNINKRNRVKGTITILASLLLGSAILRITLSATEVMAESTETPTSEMQTIKTEETAPMPTSKLLQALLKREQRVATQEQVILSREKALSVAKFEVERRLEALENAESALSATLARANTGAENDVTQLVKVYESMKPKDTAEIFETMEPGFAAGFLGRMRPDAAAGIMTGLSPKAAYTISVILAGRNANAPKN